MKIYSKIILAVLPLFMLHSCVQPRTHDFENVPQTQSVVLPADGDLPIAGLDAVEKPTTTITFARVGESYEVSTGEKVNIIYDGINDEDTYLMYESVDDGYILTLSYLNEPVDIEFDRMCQTYVVASPEATTISISETLQYEQIIWTPRFDGTWEVRVGTVNRGCRSPALKHLNKLRGRQYNKQIKASRIK